MMRYGIPIVLACLYVVGSTWLVANEGRAYRESLRRARPAANASPAPPDGQDSPAEIAGTADVRPESPPPRREAPPPTSPPVRENPPPPPVAEVKGPSPAMPAPVASAATSTPKPAPVPVASPAPNELMARIEQWKNDPFWSQPELARSWDLDHFTVAEERQLGAQLNALILELNAEDRDADLQRVKAAARPLLEKLPAKDREYRFFVLNSVVPNAFSHPGGYIYLSRKLLEMIPEDENYLLEFVVGHEIAHVELQHALKCLKDPGVRKFQDGTLPKLYFLVLRYGYPDELEYAADDWVFRRMKSLRRSEHDCFSFLRKLDHYAKGHGFPNGRGKLEDLLQEKPRKGEDGPAVSPIDNHLRSHPAAYDRLARLKELGAAARK
jgi:hypothetical protein